MAKRKLTFEFECDKDIADETFELCARYLWDKGYGEHYDEDDAPILFDDLKENDKDDIISAYFGEMLFNCAQTQDSVTGQTTVRDAINTKWKERKWDD